MFKNGVFKNNFTIESCENSTFKTSKNWNYSNVKSLIANILSLYCQYTISLHIIGKVSQSDFDISSDYSNCPYYQSLGSLSLYSENMFYSRSNFRPRVISLLLPIVQLLVLTSLTLKMFMKSQSLKFFQTFFRSICRICKDIFAGVILVKYFFKYIAVMNGRWSNFVLANKSDSNLLEFPRPLSARFPLCYYVVLELLR